MVTHVVVSFGAADGGAMFAQWLHRELVKWKGYTESDNVYLDTFALDRVPNTTYKMREIRPTAGGLASLNEEWEKYYKQAISTAHTMIFVATAAWFSSSYCRRELDYFITENQFRARGGLHPVFGVALTFPDSEMSSDFEKMTVIQTRKSYVVADKKKRLTLTGNYRDFWIVDEATLQKVVNAIG